MCVAVISLNNPLFPPRPCTPPFARVPVLRTPLEALFLQVKAMRENEDVKLFLSKAIDPPSTSQMDAAWQTLMDLGCVEGEDATSRLTALGKHMSSIRTYLDIFFSFRFLSSYPL